MSAKSGWNPKSSDSFSNPFNAPNCPCYEEIRREMQHRVIMEKPSSAHSRAQIGTAQILGLDLIRLLTLKKRAGSV